MVIANAPGSRFPAERIPRGRSRLSPTGGSILASRTRYTPTIFRRDRLIGKDFRLVLDTSISMELRPDSPAEAA